jgi:hypothetical protein
MEGRQQVHVTCQRFGKQTQSQSRTQDVRGVVVVQSSVKKQVVASYQPRADQKKSLASIHFSLCTEQSLDIDSYSMHATAPRTPMSRANKPSGPDHEPSPMLSLFFHPANYSACATLKANSNLSIVVAKANQKYRGPSKMQSRQVRLIFRVQLLLTLRESDWCECWSLQQQLPWPPWLPCFPSPSSSSAF